MSSKTRTRKTRTTVSTTGTIRTLRSVPEQTIAAKARTEAEDKLWEALHAAPNSTAADLSATAKIGKSTAQKFLVKWATEGSVTRTAGIAQGSRRAADLWAITDVDTQDDPPPQVDTSAAEDIDTTDIDTADITQAESVAPDTPDADDPVEQTDAAVDDAQHPDETESASLVHAEPVVAEVNQPATDDAATNVDKPTEDDADAPGEKTTSGQPRVRNSGSSATRRLSRVG